jgi:transcriptional regulator
VKVHRWKDIRGKGKSPERLAAIQAAVDRELVEMDLRAIREVAGKTQEEVAEIAGMTQGEVSRLERREDYRLSTLRTFVKSLGGELEVYAAFGDKKVRVRAGE